MKISDKEFFYRLNECKNKHELLDLFVKNAENLDATTFSELDLPDSNSAIKMRAFPLQNTWKFLQPPKVVDDAFLKNAKLGKVKIEKKMNKQDAALLSIDKMIKESWGGSKEFKEYVNEHIKKEASNTKEDKKPLSPAIINAIVGKSNS